MSDDLPHTIDFDELVAVMGRVKPIFSRPIKGMGKRILVPMVFKFGDKVAEFFCEAAILVDRPQKPALGFTKDDVNYFRGVTLYDVEYMKSEDDSKPDGEVLFFDDFLSKYVSEPATRAYLHRKMDELEDAVQMDEESLGSVNEAYMNRDVGEKIIDLKIH